MNQSADWKEAADHVRAVMSELLEEHFGERCPDVNWGCAICDRWGHLDRLLANPHEDEANPASSEGNVQEMMVELVDSTLPTVEILGSQVNGVWPKLESYRSMAIPRVGDSVSVEYWQAEVCAVEWGFTKGRVYVYVFCDTEEIDRKREQACELTKQQGGSE